MLNPNELHLIEPEVAEELHEQWVRGPFTQELLKSLIKEQGELYETLLGFAANNMQDLVRITSTLNRLLIIERTMQYVRTRKHE
jgi:hypothetical protein